jgi:phage baseplate assembly protein W
MDDIPVLKRKSLSLYSDINRNFGEVGQPDLLFDSKAISQALINIFRTSIGEAGRIHDPEFGSGLPELLQEPMDEQTAFKVKAATIQAAQRFEPRIDVLVGNSAILIDETLPGYKVYLVYVIRQTGEVSNTAFNLTSRMSVTSSVPPTPAPQPWSPLSESSLALWIDPSDAAHIRHGISALRVALDKSPNGYEFPCEALEYNTTPIVYSHGVINGLSALKVPTYGTVSYRSDLVIPEAVNLEWERLHAFIVLRNAVPQIDQTNGDSYGFDLFPVYNGDFSTVQQSLLSVRYGNDLLTAYPKVSHVSPAGSLISARKDFLLGNDPFLIDVKLDAGEVTISYNTNEILSGASTFNETLAYSILRGIKGGVPLETSTLYVGDIIIYNASLSDATIAITRSYLQSKWSIP